MPPINIVADPLVPSTYVAGCLFVTRQDFTDHRDIRKALISAEMTGMNVLGFIFYGEKISEGSYYSRRYYRKYYNKYDYRKRPAEVAAMQAAQMQQEGNNATTVISNASSIKTFNENRSVNNISTVGGVIKPSNAASWQRLRKTDHLSESIPQENVNTARKDSTNTIVSVTQDSSGQDVQSTIANNKALNNSSTDEIYTADKNDVQIKDVQTSLSGTKKTTSAQVKMTEAIDRISSMANRLKHRK